MLNRKQKVKLETGKKSKSFMSSILKTPKRKTGFMSGMGGAAIIILALVVSNITGNSSIQTIGFIGGIIVIIVPLAMLDLKASRKRESIDRNLPIFLLTLTSSVQSGQSLLRAIEESANRNMGSLTPELKNLRANISWGMPVEEAFENFKKRVGTRMANRVMVLLQLAMQIGGDIVDTLEVIQKHVTEMANVEKERQSSLRPYIFTIYISFAVFLGITVILVSQFFVQIEEVQKNLIETTKERGGVPSGGMFGSLMSVKVKDLTTVMFHMAIVEAIVGGLAAGKIGESSFVAGVKHIVIMVVISIVGFGAIGAL
jgi:flagellar protein FlaJ